jgi:O-antigen/teichoic acid export membrane protein
MANDEHTTDVASGSAAAQEHPAEAHIHLPPNSWSPISVAFALTMCFIGTLSATWVWVIGLVWLIASLWAWFRGARNEYRELPESLGEH